ncbi:MAG: right-handed parallel beta-helix repeat-containing protein [Eubacterium sp.]|nr:right-handed parallel beta-helix repeat-containing protein [Eubacterium sp.]
MCSLFKKFLTFTLCPAFALSAQIPDVGAEETNNLANDLDWYYRAFGQSTDIFFQGPTNGPGQNGINHVWINPGWLDSARSINSRAGFIPNKAQLGQAIKSDSPIKISDSDKIVLESRGGKIAVGHMAATCFYTKLPTEKNYVLTARVTKLFVGAHPSVDGATNNQTAGGMAAFDVVGSHRMDPPVEGYEEIPAITNYAGIGFTGRNNSQDQTGSIFSDGCDSPIFAVGAVGTNGARDLTKQALGVSLIYKLERKNDGFYMTLYNTDGETLKSETLIYDKADCVERIDKDNMYWGFFAARETRLLVENIEVFEMGTANIKTSESPGGYINPDHEVKMVSRTETGLADYTLNLKSNFDGNLSIKLGNKNVFNGKVEVYGEVVANAELKEGKNFFEYKIGDVEGSFSVTFNADKDSAGWETIWADLNGLGDRSGKDRDNRTSMASAVKMAEPGQIIYLVDGDYKEAEIVLEGTGGNSKKRVKICPEPGVEHIKLSGLSIQGSYWHVERFITGGSGPEDRGGWLQNNGDFNIIENCVLEFAKNGIGVAGYDNGLPPEAWSRGNLFINCTSRYNRDDALNNADGYHSMAGGPGNVMRGCVAHHNVDDGFDMFTRVSTGPSYPMTYENCVAYANGHNGFKLGGEGQPSNHILKNCISFDNVMANFSDNFNPGDLRLYNCVSLDALDQNYLLRDNPVIKPENKLIDSISLRTAAKGKNDAVSGTVENSSLSIGGISKIGDYTVTANDFISVERPSFFEISEKGGHINGINLIKLTDTDVGDFISRDENGDIILGDFLKLKKTSPLYEMGLGLK